MTVEQMKELILINHYEFEENLSKMTDSEIERLHQEMVYDEVYIDEDTGVSTLITLESLEEEKKWGKVLQKQLADKVNKTLTEVVLEDLTMDELFDLKGFTKNEIRKALGNNGVVLSNKAFTKIKRNDLIKQLYEVMHPENNKSEQEEKEMNKQPIPITTDVETTQETCGNDEKFVIITTGKVFDDEPETSVDNEMPVVNGDNSAKVTVPIPGSDNTEETPVTPPVNKPDTSLNEDEAEVDTSKPRRSKTIKEVVYEVLQLIIEAQYHSQKQYAKNYISDQKLTSCIRKVLHGRYSVDFKTKEMNVFTTEEDILTQKLKNIMVKNYHLIPYKSSGYVITSERMAWYYETRLNKHVLYRFTSTSAKDGKRLHIDFKIDYKNKKILNLTTGNVSELDKAGWEKIDKTMLYLKYQDIETGANKPKNKPAKSTQPDEKSNVTPPAAKSTDKPVAKSTDKPVANNCSKALEVANDILVRYLNGDKSVTEAQYNSALKLIEVLK